MKCGYQQVFFFFMKNNDPTLRYYDYIWLIILRSARIDYIRLIKYVCVLRFFGLSDRISGAQFWTIYHQNVYRICLRRFGGHTKNGIGTEVNVHETITFVTIKKPTIKMQKWIGRRQCCKAFKYFLNIKMRILNTFLKNTRNSISNN